MDSWKILSAVAVTGIAILLITRRKDSPSIPFDQPAQDPQSGATFKAIWRGGTPHPGSPEPFRVMQTVKGNLTVLSSGPLLDYVKNPDGSRALASLSAGAMADNQNAAMRAYGLRMATSGFGYVGTYR